MQVIHAEERAGWKKVESAAKAIKALNSEVQVVTHDRVRWSTQSDHPPDVLGPFPNARTHASTHHHPTNPKPFTAATAARLLRSYDLVVDASDNPATRYLLNDACVLVGGGGRGSRVPLVSGAALGTEGQVCGGLNR